MRPVLLALIAGTGVMYLWALGASGWSNDFYAAAVQAGSKSWKAFFFGSFDSSNFITVDKPPAFLWVMDLSARIFGLNSWSLLVPEAVEGMLTVLLVYVTVRALVLPAVRPDRRRGAGDHSGRGADVQDERPGRAAAPAAGRIGVLHGAGDRLGQDHDGCSSPGLQSDSRSSPSSLLAFLVLPALAGAYLLAGPPKIGRRIVQVLLGGLAVVVSAGWWVAVVQLHPGRRTGRTSVGRPTTTSCS